MTRWPSLLVLGWAIGTSPLAAQAVHYEGGASVATGAYIFTERTTSWSIFNGLALSAGPLTLRASLPVYMQNSTLLTGTTGGLVPTGGSHSGAVADSSAARTGRGQRRGGDPVAVPASAVGEFRSALGDPSLHLSAALPASSKTSFSVGAAAKVPLTDTTSFGTGQWDIGASATVSQVVGLSWLLGLDVSYWHLGDMPDLELRDPLLVSASVAYLSSSAWGASTSISAAGSPIEGFENAYSITAGVTRVGSGGAVGITVSVGLSETAPDFGLGVNWRMRLAGR